MDDNIDIEIVDFMDLINHTLSNDFVNKWRHKYSEKFIKHFQLKLLEYLNKQRPLKLNTLYLYLTKKCRFSKEVVDNFFETIDIGLYYPFIFSKTKNS
jgi:hypothetical protein